MKKHYSLYVLLVFVEWFKNGSLAWVASLRRATTTNNPRKILAIGSCSQSPSFVSLLATSSSSSSSSSSDNPSKEERSTVTCRRKWFSQLAQKITAAVVLAGTIPTSPSSIANAVTPLISTASACDPSVSVWQRQGRTIYLLGTAHVSSKSAELAGSLVNDVHPNAVFVELDAKRVKGSGILAKRVPTDMMEGNTNTDGSTASVPQSKIIIPDIRRLTAEATPSTTTGEASSTAMASSSLPETSSSSSTIAPSKPQNRNPLMGAASMAVGNAIRGMYSKMDSAGFKSGDEFIVAMKEGQAMGSDIILGDRDVEITLRRLTEGLAQTDLNALLNPDSELETSLKELVPSSMKSSNDPMATDLTNEQFRDEFSNFVEVMKNKENVRKIMTQLKLTAPALYEALVAERDVYMAAGLNGLNDYEAIVAVMGIAHVDGVEASLQMNGWKAAPLSCPRQAS